MDSLLLRSFSPSSRMSISSMLILPVGSAKRNKVESKDDLPAPVRPTTPIYNQKLKRVQLYTWLFKSYCKFNWSTFFFTFLKVKPYVIWMLNTRGYTHVNCNMFQCKLFNLIKRNIFTESNKVETLRSRLNKSAFPSSEAFIRF